MTTFQSVVVPTVPPQPPQVTLLGSAVKPASGSDPSNPIYELTAEQLAALPDDQRAELAKRQGDSWVRGLTYQPESHDALQAAGACTVESQHGPKLTQQENPSIVEYVPFVVVAEDVCSTFGFEEHDFKGRALRKLENGTPHALEREFWTGVVAQAEKYPNNFLTSSGAADLTPVAVPSATRGLQILQDALASCGFGGRGMIHCVPEAAPNLLGGRRIGADYLDIFDNLIIPGVGYPGTGPEKAGKPENAEEIKTREGKRETWMYATDLVIARKSDPEVFPDTFAEATDWGQGTHPNTVTFYAERFLAAYFDGACHFAVKVQLPA